MNTSTSTVTSREIITECSLDNKFLNILGAYCLPAPYTLHLLQVFCLAVPTALMDLGAKPWNPIMSYMCYSLKQWPLNDQLAKLLLAKLGKTGLGSGVCGSMLNLNCKNGKGHRLKLCTYIYIYIYIYILIDVCKVGDVSHLYFQTV